MEPFNKIDAMMQYAGCLGAYIHWVVWFFYTSSGAYIYWGALHELEIGRRKPVVWLGKFSGPLGFSGTIWFVEN